MPMPTLLDIAKANGSDDVVGLIDETTKAVPEMTGRAMFLGEERVIPNVGYMRTIDGQQYKTLVRTSLPTAQFRGANKGVTSSKSAYENRLVSTYIANSRWECDKAVADVHEDGPEAFIAIEGSGHLEANFQLCGRQFYYGRSNGGDSDGHPGLMESVAASMVVDATGSTANGGTSVWAVKFGPKDVAWVLGENGELKLSEVRIESVAQADDATKKFTAYVQEMLYYIGVQVVSETSCARIKNLTMQAGKTLDDDMLADLIAKFPEGKKPDAIFMNGQSLTQLKKSRTATNESGRPAPTPVDYEGIPIVPTGNITKTEAIA